MEISELLELRKKGVVFESGKLAFEKPGNKNQKRGRIINPKCFKEYATTHFFCEKCGVSHPLSPPHHIIYKSEGGGDVWENLIMLCIHCHDWAHALNKEGQSVKKKKRQLILFKIKGVDPNNVPGWKKAA